MPLYKSTNFGESWGENIEPEIGTPANVIAMSKDGSIIIIAACTLILISKDSGDNWEIIDPIVEGEGEISYANISISTDGNIIVVCYYYFTTTIHYVASLSIDGGDTWNKIGAFSNVIISKDGLILLNSGNIYPSYSKDNGDTWINCTPNILPPPEPYIYWLWNLAMNIDGTKFIAGCLPVKNPM